MAIFNREAREAKKAEKAEKKASRGRADGNGVQDQETHEQGPDEVSTSVTGRDSDPSLADSHDAGIAEPTQAQTVAGDGPLADQRADEPATRAPTPPSAPSAAAVAPEQIADAQPMARMPTTVSAAQSSAVVPVNQPEPSATADHPAGAAAASTMSPQRVILGGGEGGQRVRRGAIPVKSPPLAQPDALQTKGARNERVIPVPPVLVGNPSLGSDPLGLPRVPAATPDSVLDGARFGPFTVRAASLRGDDHRHNSETRQDAIGIWALDPLPALETDSPVLLACVADGVGSHPLSHLGSAQACSLLKKHVAAYFPHLVGRDKELIERACRQVITDVAAGLRVLADDNRLEAKQVSTTLTACLVIPGRKNEEGSVARGVVFNVGDSPSLRLREGRWISFRHKDESDVMDTGTDALPTRPDSCQVSVSDLYTGDMIMLCTDGLGGPLERNASVGDQLAEWWGGHIPSLPEFYWQLSFRAQTYGDDRSAVCIWLDDNQ